MSPGLRRHPLFATSFLLPVLAALLCSACGDEGSDADLPSARDEATSPDDAAAAPKNPATAPDDAATVSADASAEADAEPADDFWSQASVPGGFSGEPGAPSLLDITPYTTTVTLDEQTALGFSARDLAPIIEGTHAGRLVWADGRETEFSFTFEYGPDEVVVTDLRDFSLADCSQENIEECLYFWFDGRGVLNSNDGAFVDEAVVCHVTVTLLAQTEGFQAGPLYFGALGCPIPEPPELNGTFDRSIAGIDESAYEEVGAGFHAVFGLDGFEEAKLGAGGRSGKVDSGETTVISVLLADIYLE